MEKITTFEQFEKISNSNQDIYKKLLLLNEEGFKISNFEYIENIYIGRPTGFTSFNIVNFVKDSEERQLCIYKRNNKIELFKGSYKKLIRQNIALQNNNNIPLIKEIANVIIDIILKHSTIIDNINIRQYFLSNNKEYILKSFNILFNNSDKKTIEFNDEEIDIKEFICNEINGNIINDEISSGFFDRIIYVRNTLYYLIGQSLKETYLQEGNIENYRRILKENTSSIIGLSSVQNDFIQFICKNGNSTDLQNIIYGDTKSGRKEIFIANCDILLEALRANNGSNVFLSYQLLFPIINALKNANKIGKGYKQHIQKLIYEYIVKQEKVNPKVIIQILEYDDVQNKPDFVTSYLKALINNDKKELEKIADTKLTQKSKINKKIGLIKNEIKELNPISNQMLFLIIDEQFDDWNIIDNDIIVYENNKFYQKTIEYKYSIKNLNHIIDKNNKKIEEEIKEIAKIIVENGIRNNIKNEEIEIISDNENPCLKFTVYDFSNRKNKKSFKMINFTENQKQKILTNNNNNNILMDKINASFFISDSQKNSILNELITNIIVKKII